MDTFIKFFKEQIKISREKTMISKNPLDIDFNRKIHDY